LYRHIFLSKFYFDSNLVELLIVRVAIVIYFFVKIVSQKLCLSQSSENLLKNSQDSLDINQKRQKRSSKEVALSVSCF